MGGGVPGGVPGLTGSPREEESISRHSSVDRTAEMENKPHCFDMLCPKSQT